MFKYKTLRDLVYDYIGQQLRAGVIKPTSTIKETALSEELSISRTPVREALIQLTGAGLLESVPHKGFRIRTLTEAEAQELFVVIGHLEGLAARLSLSNIQEQDIATMKMHIGMMNAAITADDVEMYLEVQDKFHSIYLDKCANRTLPETLERLKSRLFRHHYQTMSKDEREKFLLGLNGEHTHICELFAVRDADALERYLIDVHWNPAEAFYEVLG